MPGAGGTDLPDDEVFASLLALGGYYATRADLCRMAHVVESLSAGFGEGGRWFGPMIEDWLRGDDLAVRRVRHCAFAS